MVSRGYAFDPLRMIEDPEGELGEEENREDDTRQATTLFSACRALCVYALLDLADRF
jgi:hypothetical protein